MTFQRLGKTLAALCLAAFTLNALGTDAAEPAPRLMLTDTRLAELKELARSDAVLRRYVASVLKQADKFIGAKKLERVLVGPRLLFVSRDMLARTYALGLAYRWTGEKKYLDAEAKNLELVCGFKDWNPSHYLDVAEMTHAVAIGYDWLRRDLPPELRETVRKKLIELGVGDGAKRVQAGKAHWTSGNNNWTQVCCAGLIVGALAVQDTDPSLWESLRDPLLNGLRKADKLYAPDGAWDEGVGYWHYATAYLVYALAALESATGGDFDLSKAEGLNAAAYFPAYLTAPTGSYYSFADVGRMSDRNPGPVMFWLAKKFNLPDILADEHAVAQDEEAKPGHVLWYAPPPASVPGFALDKVFHGRVPVVVMRTAWNDPKAWWVGIKAGDNMVSHGHLDVGSFEFEAEGVRWAVELGSDDYNMPGYFGDKRWTYYRLQTRSHNAFLIDQADQPPKGRSQLVAFEPGAEVSTATMDLSGAYPAARKAVRTIALNRKTPEFRVSDTITLAEKHDIIWGITTAAGIELTAKNQALLKQDGKTIRAVIESPVGAEFSTASCRQEAPQNPNEGFRRLEVRLAGVSGEQQIVVKFVR